MHTDEDKRYDKRTIERDLREGLISPREYEEYLRKIPDVSNKVFQSAEKAHLSKRERKKSKRIPRPQPDQPVRDG